MMFDRHTDTGIPGAASGDMRMSDDKIDGPEPSGRRQTDRRKSQQPFEGPDRRKGDRRTGEDRRTTPRSEDLGSPDD